MVGLSHFAHSVESMQGFALHLLTTSSLVGGLTGPDLIGA